MDTCPFCTTYKDLPSAPGGMLYEDDLVYAYHFCQAEGQAVGLGVARLSKALKACTGADKIYVEAYYEVNPHSHLILTARYPGTPQEYWRWNVGDWPAAPTGGSEAITTLCTQLRASLAQRVPGHVEQKVS